MTVVSGSAPSLPRNGGSFSGVVLNIVVKFACRRFMCAAVSLAEDFVVAGLA
jgi:hypothetical protein